MSNECFINGNKLSINELLSLVHTEQYNKLEEAWLEVVESNNKNLSALFEVVDLLNKREEKKTRTGLPHNAYASLQTKRPLSRCPGDIKKGTGI